jgi:DNA-binding transcriptional LysR family regulator
MIKDLTADAAEYGERTFARLKRPILDLRHLYYFVTVAETSNFRRASARLGVAQPALSRQIAAMEDAVQVRLFDRLASGVQLTPSGEVLYREARTILTKVERAVEQTQLAAKEGAGVIALGFTNSALRNRKVLRSLNRIRTRYPGLQIKAQAGVSYWQENDVKTGKIDAGFMFGQHISDEFETLLVDVDDYQLAMRADHPLVRAKSLTLQSLQNESFIWTDPDAYPLQHARLMTACANAGLVPNIVQHSNSDHMMLSFVRSGFGVAFVPLTATLQEDIVVRRVEDLSVPTDLLMVWRPTGMSLALEQFVACVREEVAGSGLKPSRRAKPTLREVRKGE